MDEVTEIPTQKEASALAARERAILRATLASIPEARFLNALWAARAIQNGNPVSGQRLLGGVPHQAVGATIESKFAIHPWELELLANERLAIDPSALFLEIHPESWSQISTLVNLVRSIENNESVEFSGDNPSFDILYKIGNRQFEWQSGFLTKQEIFRSTFIYGQGICAEFFQRRYGISVNDFSVTCFAFYTLYQNHPNAFRTGDFSILGIDQEVKNKVLDLISVHIRDAKKLAKQERNFAGEMAYKPSIVRKYPLIGVTARSHKLCCPFPELLINRMTYGLFYDVVDGGGPVREEFGKRFEQYLKMVFDSLLPSIRCEPEITFDTKKGQRKSTDLIVFDEDGFAKLLIECKAARLSYKARYSTFDRNERGYREMIKGVMQIWKFASDIRNERVDIKSSGHPIGSVITLDSWFVGAPNRQEAVIEAARALAANDPDIEIVDMLPISFAYMPELERAMALGNPSALIEVFENLTKPERRGYSFDVAIREDGVGDSGFQSFPFENRMKEILPWWGVFDKMDQERRDNQNLSS